MSNTITNKNDSNKASVLAQLDKLRAALKSEPPGAAITQALEQCDRLQLAISQFHAEGLRFAAFTLLRLMQRPEANLGEAVQRATRDLKSALETAGFPH
jgi:hypothetical protein